VLDVLAATTSPRTGGEVTRRMDQGSREGVRRVLARLVSQGIVLADVRAGTTLYSLNRDHVTAGAIVEITRARGAIIDRIIGHLSRWESLHAIPASSVPSPGETRTTAATSTSSSSCPTPAATRLVGQYR
jgi:DNA-binding transcriptional ArsR family regulator